MTKEEIIALGVTEEQAAKVLEMHEKEQGETNAKLTETEAKLSAAEKNLKPGGRLAVITFHSLEDRIVKRELQALATGCTCPPEFPVCVCGKKPKMKLITRKPIVSGDEELNDNPRARSAKLRVAEKC